MHYEKKGFYKISQKKTLANAALIALTSIIVILLMYIHAPSEFWWPIKFIDVINAIAQIATAAAFFLAIHQYRKNKESERQKVLIEEARTLITKMKTAADDFSVGEGPSLSGAITFMNNMSSHAGNFNAIFEVLSEEIHKAIIRMHWQDMFFNEFNKAIQHFNKTIHLTHFNVNAITYIKALNESKKLNYPANPPLPPFSDYIKLQYLANSRHIKDEIKISNDDQLTMIFFERNFFDNDGLKDHLFGCFNIIDVRVRSPLIAVLNERYLLQPPERDSQAYKAFYPESES